MRRFTIAGALALSGVVLLAHPTSAQHPILSCPARFDALVTSGPDTGRTIGGELELSVGPAGRALGTLALDNGRHVIVTGRVDGLDVSLVLDGLHISGVGTTDGDFATCSGTSAGQLFGPRRDDFGDWGIIWGS